MCCEPLKVSARDRRDHALNIPMPCVHEQAQLRMSKKVAQLTKVIYHLNSKNEDHDLDMQDMVEQYEAELEKVLKDASEKVNFFKARLEEGSDEKRVQEVARVRVWGGSAGVAVSLADRHASAGKSLGLARRAARSQ